MMARLLSEASLTEVVHDVNPQNDLLSSSRNLTAFNKQIQICNQMIIWQRHCKETKRINLV